ncbi:hypothetical protein GCM10010191_73410 [Actinomadura vinacea]|uniref:Secreted protein n=1 Tax=Actinomadura vinacea TaxID=115336 RepID=A0ABN3K0D7_9ACTN
MMFRRFAAASALTMAVGGVLLGAGSAAMAEAAVAHPKGGEHDTIDANKKHDNDKFENDNAQVCFVVFAPVNVDSKVEHSPVDIKNHCDQKVDQDNEGDENQLKEHGKERGKK